MIDMNRTQEIFARVSKEEKKIMEQKAKENGMKLSEYLRAVALHTKKINIEVIN